MLHSGRRIFRKSADMKFIDHQIAHISGGLRHLTPVKSIFDNPCSIVSCYFLAPGALSGHCPGIGIQENLLPVKEQSFLRIIWSVHPVGILKVFNIETEDQHGIHVTDLI